MANLTENDQEVVKKAQLSLNTLIETHPFKELLGEEIESPEFKKFLTQRIVERNDYKMNLKVTEYFNNFNKYQNKIKKVIVVESHNDCVKLQELGYFKNPNENLFIVLNNTYSTNKETGKVKIHYDYWRLFTANALSYCTEKLENSVQYLFIGTDVCHDYATLVPENLEKVFLPETSAECWSSEELKGIVFEEYIS